jgi:hypothetical protein
VAPRPASTPLPSLCGPTGQVPHAPTTHRVCRNHAVGGEALQENLVAEGL